MNIVNDPPNMPPPSAGKLPTIIQLEVDGMTCCGSVLGVKKALNVLYGVQDVEVRMSTGQVVVKGDGENVTQEKLERALRAVGYSVGQKHTEAS
jgi:copper chaperone CopZ